MRDKHAYGKSDVLATDAVVSVSRIHFHRSTTSATAFSVLPITAGLGRARLVSEINAAFNLRRKHGTTSMRSARMSCSSRACNTDTAEFKRMKQPTQPPLTGTTNGQAFYEDMGRKARWFAEIRGTRDFAALDRLRDRAVAHVEVMREARLTRLDPGGGRIAKQNALVGVRRGAKISVVDLPGHVREGFITDAVEVASSKEDLRCDPEAKASPPRALGPRSAHRAHVPLRQ